MKKIYNSPQIEVIEIVLESSLLVSSPLGGTVDDPTDSGYLASPFIF